jgi:hypothetical protein
LRRQNVRTEHLKKGKAFLKEAGKRSFLTVGLKMRGESANGFRMFGDRTYGVS